MSERSKVEQLCEAIHQARARVYQVGDPTPLERIPLDGVSHDVWVKREDLGPIKAYKWRGAFNAMACLTKEQLEAGVVVASAGNHAQGIALAAKELGTRARIYMPEPTPEVKRRAVMAHGGEAVEIRLVGDRFAEAQAAAMEDIERSGATLIPPFDSLEVMAGQGTMADEIFASGEGPFDRVYVAIGGGGMAAGVAALLKSSWPEVKVIGVEGEGQASMKAALAAGKPVSLDYVDVFCDGTAVTQVGALTYELCESLLDEIVTVSNEEVCAAIKDHWDGLRVIPEPSGAMSLAGFLKDQRAGRVSEGEKVLTILCGANMDFAKFADVSRQAGIGLEEHRSWRFSIPARKGALADLLGGLPERVSIMDLQYGRTVRDPQRPLLTLDVPEQARADFEAWMSQNEGLVEEVTNDGATRFRAIPFAPSLLVAPLFVEVEFPERAGALLGFMRTIRELTTLCYFNYRYTGERVGRALIGLDFESGEDRERCRAEIFGQAGETVRAVREVMIDALI